jgi:hypothetical protein
MPVTSYISNGFCLTPTAEDRRRGFDEVRLWNPTPYENKVELRAYFADRDPVDLKALVVKPYGNPLMMFPNRDREIFTDVGPWGMRLVSDHVLLGDHILLAGHAAAGDPLRGAEVSQVQLTAGLFGPPERTQYAGGVGDCMLRTRLSKVWYFSDGIIIKTNPEKPSFPFSEFEWYHFLNPGPREATVRMHRYLGNGGHDVLEYAVGAERVLLVSNYDPDAPGVDYGIRFECSEPVAIECERLIYSYAGLDAWGSHIHCQRPGLPGPLDWNEEPA